MAATSEQAENLELTIVLEGDVVASTTVGLRTRLKVAIAAGTRQIVLNLGKCTMVDSSGIGLFVAIHNSLAKVGGNLKLVGVNTDLRDLLQAMRLQQHFSIEG
jgi:serine/threonine-protein kinase RsbW